MALVTYTDETHLCKSVWSYNRQKEKTQRDKSLRNGRDWYSEYLAGTHSMIDVYCSFNGAGDVQCLRARKQAGTTPAKTRKVYAYLDGLRIHGQ